MKNALKNRDKSDPEIKAGMSRLLKTLYYLSSNELTPDGESALGVLKTMFNKKTIDNAKALYRNMAKNTRGGIYASPSVGKRARPVSRPPSRPPSRPASARKKIPKRKIPRIPKKGGGGVSRLGRINKKFNIDVTEETDVKRNLDAVSRDVLKKVLKVYRRAKKKFPKEEDISKMERYITEMFTRPNKVRSLVKRSMK